jgi:hypothetical protein
MVIVFYTAVQSWFLFLDASGYVTVVSISATLPNGTQSLTGLDAKEAVVTTVKDGSSGNFPGGWSCVLWVTEYVVLH